MKNHPQPQPKKTTVKNRTNTQKLVLSGTVFTPTSIREFASSWQAHIRA